MDTGSITSIDRFAGWTAVVTGGAPVRQGGRGAQSDRIHCGTSSTVI